MGDFRPAIFDQKLGVLSFSRRSVVKTSLRSLPLTGLGANLFGVNLSVADLSSANLSNANLRGADLSGVLNLEDAILSPSQRADLKKKGLRLIASTTTTVTGLAFGTCFRQT